MKLSLQSKTNLKNTYEKREAMIVSEGLHINDRIDYERFIILYKKYVFLLENIEKQVLL